jgi:deoxyadenosine/deoxycytidine kinase
MYQYAISLIVKPNQRWYIIEGNIGCGKSTMLSLLRNEKDVEVIEEPVHVWKDIKEEKEDGQGENILGLFYKNPSRYAYLFQTIVFKTRMMALEPKQEKPIRFSERSIWTDKNIFSKSCFEMGHMSSIEKSAYDVWFDWLERKITRKPDGIIYLRATPEVCLDRVRQRHREEESSVSLDYLTVIHDKHEKWLMNPSYNGIPIYIIENAHSMTSLEQIKSIGM